jgi:hypothetical protein
LEKMDWHIGNFGLIIWTEWMDHNLCRSGS